MIEDEKQRNEIAFESLKQYVAEKVLDERILKNDPVIWYCMDLDQFFFGCSKALGSKDPSNMIKTIRQLEDFKETDILNKDAGHFGLYGLEDFIKVHPFSGMDAFEDQSVMRVIPQREVYLYLYARFYMDHPQAELLSKAGFSKLIWRYLKETVSVPSGRKEEFRLFDQVFHNGEDVSEITGLKRKQWQTLLKYTDDFNVWKEYALFIRERDLNEKTLERVLLTENKEHFGQSIKEIKEILKAYGKTYDLESLLNYLEKMNKVQGGSAYSTMLLLEDYLHMCSRMGVEAKAFSVDLQKDHDVISRNLQLQINKEMAKKCKKGFARQRQKLSKYQYENERLKIVIPEKAEDLINEGVNNHNCVASFIEDHASGKTNVLFIRKKEEPEKSYITLELGNQLNVRQAFYGYNRKISDSNDMKFIDDWMNNVVRKGGQDHYGK